MCVVKSPTDDALQALLPSLDRNTLPNKKLISLKKKKRVLWNHTILRFRWHEDTCAARGAAEGDLVAQPETQAEAAAALHVAYPEVSQRVADLMRAPLTGQHVFVLRNWAKYLDAACKGSGSKKAVSTSSTSLALRTKDPCNNIGCS